MNKRVLSEAELTLSHAEALRRLNRILREGDRLPEHGVPGTGWQSVQDDARELAGHAERCLRCRNPSAKLRLLLDNVWDLLTRKDYPMVAIGAPTLMP